MNLYAQPQVIVICIFIGFMGFCLGNIFQLSIQNTKTKPNKKNNIEQK